MRLSQPFHSAFQTFDAMRAHYTFKHWHGSNFSWQNLPTLNSWFPSTSVHLVFNELTRQFRRWSGMIESGSVPEAGPWPRIRMESSSGLVSPPNSRHRHANLGRMQITFHNLLPVPEFIAPILLQIFRHVPLNFNRLISLRCLLSLFLPSNSRLPFFFFLTDFSFSFKLFV